MRIQKEILSVLAYHDIFDYPLTLDEVNKFITIKATNHQIESAIEKINPIIKSKKGFFYLKKRDKLVHTRLTRAKYSVQKLRRANYYKNILRLVPTIKLIAITGALALDNSAKNDDIDLLIISSKNTIWTTRLAANLLLWPYKRSPNNAFQSDKACLNIFIDESCLKITSENLYTAHEIAQMKVIYDKESTYKKFIIANKWIYNYLPNWSTNQPRQPKTLSKKLKTHSTKAQQKALVFLEMLSKQTQLKYMKSKITTEQIGDYQLFFHPKSTQLTVLTIYAQKLKQLKLR